MPNLHPCFKCVCKCEEQHQFALTCGDCDGFLIIHLMDEKIIVWSGGILLLWVCMYTCFPIHVIMLRRYTDWPQNISIYLFTPLSNSSLSFILLTSFVTLFFVSLHSQCFLNHFHCLNNDNKTTPYRKEKKPSSLPSSSRQLF